MILCIQSAKQTKLNVMLTVQIILAITKAKLEAAAMAQQLRAPVALAEDLGWVPSIHVVIS